MKNIPWPYAWEGKIPPVACIILSLHDGKLDGVVSPVPLMAVILDTKESYPGMKELAGITGYGGYVTVQEAQAENLEYLKQILANSGVET